MMPSRSLVLLAAAVTCAAGPTVCASSAVGAPAVPAAKPPPAPAASLAEVPLAELIDRLQREGEPGIGTHSTAWVSGFLPDDAVPRFRGGILGSAPPKKSPVMTELVRRGVTAVPSLLEHLTDARPTRLTVGDDFSGRWYSDEYHPRYPDSRRWPEGVNTQRNAALGGEFPPRGHTIKVGDLCYVALGQIVNRGLRAVRYQPSMCLVVNSPVQNRALAEAARKDWSGLTPEEHQASLRRDALTNEYAWSAPSALTRLLFYYPAAGRPLTVALLNRPLYDDGAAYSYLVFELVPARPEKWAGLLERYRTRFGTPAYHGLIVELISSINFPGADREPTRARAKRVATQILARCLPEIDPLAPPAFEVADLTAQESLVEQLPSRSWPELDAAVYRLYLRTVATRPTEIGERLTRADVARGCAQRLLKKGYDAKFRVFFERELRWVRQQLVLARKEQPDLPRGSAGYGPALEQRIGFYKTFLEKLPRQPPPRTRPK